MEPVLSVGRWLDVPVDGRVLGLLSKYRDWLGTEAMEAGGIGPEEVDRIERRHLADSLLFRSQLGATADEVWDLGSGAGLPGIPLAITMPQTRFVLIDRSGRRTRLLRRVVRILELDNVEVVQSDMEQIEGKVGAIVARASLPAATMTTVAKKLLIPGGTAVLGGSWTTPPHFDHWETIEIPRDVLDQPVWLLIMRVA